MRNSVKYIFLIIVLLQPFFLAAQKFDKKYFVKTYWFVNNKDSAFYKSDTLKLIKHVKLAPEWFGSGKEYAESEMTYLGHGDFIELRFQKGNSLRFNWRFQNSMYKVPINTWIWKYRKDDSTIEIYDDKGKLIIRFKSLSEKQIEVYSGFDKNMIKTVELTVIKTQ